MCLIKVMNDFYLALFTYLVNLNGITSLHIDNITKRKYDMINTIIGLGK